MSVAYLHDCHRAQPNTALRRDTYLHTRVAICIQSTFDSAEWKKQTKERFFVESLWNEDQDEKKRREKYMKKTAVVF